MTVKTTLDDGRMPFVSLLAVLGEPTRDGRKLAADGDFTMPKIGPLLTLLPESALVGCLVGAFAFDGMLYGIGVADEPVAEKLNAGALVLGMDVDVSSDDTETVDGVLVIKRAIVRGARVREPEGFAWS